MLRALILDKVARNWYTALPYVEFSINSSMSASTGKAPFELVYGTNVTLPMDLALPTQPDPYVQAAG